MNRVHHRLHVRRIAAVLGAFAVGALALVTGAAFAHPDPPIPEPAAPGPLPAPPGWNQHPPLPGHAHTAVIGGMPAGRSPSSRSRQRSSPPPWPSPWTGPTPATGP
jgi:hypothetical protein